LRLLWLNPERTVEALAMEEAILRLKLENGSPDTLCFWRGRNCVVIGYNPARDHVDVGLCKALGIPICRRYSGGGAIYQDNGNLNYSLIAAQGGSGLPRDVQRARRIIDSAVAGAMAGLGLQAQTMSGGGVSVGGRKVSGSAQFVLWGGLLHHGVIAVSTNLGVMYRLLPSNKIEVTTLERELGRKINMKKLATAIASKFADVFGAQLCIGKPTEAEMSMAQKLLDEKYLSKEWVNSGVLDA